MKKLDAIVIQKKLAQHLMLNAGYMAAFTEYHNHYGICDVYGITKSEYSVDYEVKVDKRDLVGELKSIQAIQDNVKPPKSSSKYLKHKLYIHNEKPKYPTQLDPPSTFVFVVSEDLVDVALAGVEGTPYGVWSTDGYSFNIIKRAKKLHKRKVSLREYISLVKSFSMYFALRADDLLTLLNRNETP